jgi:peroxiredoxin Q/BCP
MIKVGQKAPTFVLPSSDGTTVDLASLRGTNVVLYFYPRDMTPGCTIEAQEFRDAVPALRKLGAVVFGASKDSIESHCKFRDKHGLTFPLLTDADGAVLAAYGAWGDKMMYGKKVTGVIRSTVLIDRDGTVARHWPRVSVKRHVDEVVAAVRALVEGGAPATVARPARTTAKPVKLRTAAKKKAAARKKPAARGARARR